MIKLANLISLISIEVAMKKWLVIFTLASAFPLSAVATPVLIEQVVTTANFGWGGEGFYITLPTPVSANACPWTTQIIIQSTSSEYKTGVATVLAAITSGVSISAWVDGCVNDRPNVIGMGIKAQ